MRKTLIRAGVVSGAALSALVIGGAADAAPAAPQAPATTSRVTAVQQHPKTGIECHWKVIRVYDKIIHKTPDGKYGYRLIITFKKVPDCKITLPPPPGPVNPSCNPGNSTFHCLGG
ncbi:hypothetical protein ACFV98_11770 [Streptomyces violascens]|uniref:hypothetical protein n=1 Tax=Streptomyces violascens TaxID=67381 RepID=UPI0036643D3A